MANNNKEKKGFAKSPMANLVNGAAGQGQVDQSQPPVTNNGQIDPKRSNPQIADLPTPNQNNQDGQNPPTVGKSVNSAKGASDSQQPPTPEQSILNALYGLTKDGKPRKSKAGRKPKYEQSTTVSFDLPADLYEQYTRYKDAIGGTLGDYVIRLIKKDFAQNGNTYDEIIDLQSRVK